MQNYNIQVLKNQKLPRPDIKSGRPLVYPFDRLEVGDCFSIRVPSGLEARTLQSRLSSCARSYAARRSTTRNRMVFKTRVTKRGKTTSVGVYRVS